MIQVFRSKIFTTTVFSGKWLTIKHIHIYKVLIDGDGGRGEIQNSALIN